MTLSGALHGSETAGPSPTFSVVWHGRNRLQSARDALAALRAQTLQDFEVIVEDCGSTDGTLELFRDAASEDGRIRVFQRWRNRSGEAVLDALRRCSGEYIAICPSDGRFRPNALEIAARELARRPRAGALATEGFLVDAFGGEFPLVDIVSLLLTTYRPFLPAAFYRRSALQAVGLHDNDWFADSLALDLSCRLATDYGWASCREDLVDVPNPGKSITIAPSDVGAAIDARLGVVNRIFSPNGFFGGALEFLALESKANQLGIIWQQLRDLGYVEVEYGTRAPLSSVVWGLHLLLRTDHRTLRSLHRLFCVRSHNLGLLSTPIQKLLAATTRMHGRLPIHLAYTVWNPPFWGYWLKRKILSLTLPAPAFHPAAPTREAMYADVYGLAAARYEARGQIDLALEMWERARPPDDIDFDSSACQAILKSPTVTDAGLASYQRQWVSRHVGDRPIVAWTRKEKPSDKIRIGYHCAFMDGDTMRNMMRNVITAHDRSRFTVYGYAPRAVPPDIKKAFDVWRHTPPHTAEEKGCTDEQFAALVRRDEIDVFVELTGFSPGHRFGAMSLRCAPAQVSFLNHTGTSQVPNVDFVLSDDICTPRNSQTQRHYSEQIYRLPGCFFCFDYTTSDEPDVADPPHLKNGRITFGCFGTGGKIGSDVIEMWARILHRVPGSILHVQNPQLSICGDRQFIANRFRTFGISGERLTLEGGTERRALLQVYREIDISLDTWPYCGGNTIAESLWHGVPVVTYRGERFSSAYGASLVTAAGCRDLVASTRDQYVDLAVGLAGDSARLVRLRQNLRRMSFEHGLGDSTLFARRLEAAFVDMLKSTTTSRVDLAEPSTLVSIPGYADALRD